MRKLLIAGACVLLNLAACSSKFESHVPVVPETGQPEVVEPEVEPENPGKVIATYRNRYGYVLDEYDSGYIKVKRSMPLKKVLGEETYASLKDLKKKYIYYPDKILPEDYNRANTMTVVYKKAIHTGKRLTLEIDLPANATERTPFIVWIHGGGWHSGMPMAMSWQSKFFASHGIAGIRVQYQLMERGGQAGAKTNDEQLQDIADAVAYVKAHADEYNIDPYNYFFIGGSAGGQLAILSGARDRECRGIVPLFAVYDIKGFYNFLQEIGQLKSMEEVASFWRMDDDKVYSTMNPTDVVTPGMPPMLLIHGTGDSTAPYKFCQDFMQHMDECGNEYEHVAYKYYDHNFTGKGASDVYEEVQFKIMDFIKKHLRKAPVEF